MLAQQRRGSASRRPRAARASTDRHARSSVTAFVARELAGQPSREHVVVASLGPAWAGRSHAERGDRRDRPRARRRGQRPRGQPHPQTRCSRYRATRRSGDLGVDRDLVALDLVRRPRGPRCRRRRSPCVPAPEAQADRPRQEIQARARAPSPSSSRPRPVRAETRTEPGRASCRLRARAGAIWSDLLRTASGAVGGADLLEDGVHRGLALLHVLRGRVHDVQEEVGLDHLLQRGAEGGHQRVGQLLDEADGVDQQHVRARRPARVGGSSGSRVMKSWSEISVVRCGERVEERGLARVGVADERDHRRLARAGAPRGACARCGARARSRASTAWMRWRMRRRSVSSLVSPGPRVPMPPPSRESSTPLPARRGSR